MKALKYLLSIIAVIIVVWSCSKDEDFNNIDFLDSGVAPTAIDAQFRITQDNTGLVSITPTAEGAVSFKIDFGDSKPMSPVIKAGGLVQHVYKEGTYNVKVIASGITGLTSEFIKKIVVSFLPPQFGTTPIVKADATVSKKINVTVPNDTKFAMYFDVYFVEGGVTTIKSGNVGDTVSFIYQNPGTVTIKIVLKGGAIATTEYITTVEVVEILQPVKSAPTQPGRQSADYISIFSDAYTNVPGSDFNPWWWQQTIYSPFVLNGDNMIQYANLNYQGIQIGSEQNVTSMETLHIDVWSAKNNSIKFFPLPVGVAPQDEKFYTLDLIADQWNSFDIPLSYFSNLGLPLNRIHQFKFEGTGSFFIDNLYFYKAPSVPSILTGTWKMAPEAGALAVGPSLGDYGWWQNSLGDVTLRNCFFDDQYVFGSNGSFNNVLGGSTWMEDWQGGSTGCGTPIAPHNGTIPASFYYNETTGKITITGKGSYLGIPKPYNGGELSNPANAPDAITYDVTLSDNNNTMTLVLPYGTGYWRFKLVREVPKIVGTWKLAPEAGALAVGPSLGDYGWWQNSLGDVTTRACLFDDEYVFSSNGSFSNVLGGSTWLEGWQGVSEGCGTPIAPHNGAGIATYTYNETNGTVKVIGTGAYLGIPKPYNAGELSNPADAPGSITYDLSFSDNDNTMTLVLFYGWGYWKFKLVRN